MKFLPKIVAFFMLVAVVTGAYSSLVGNGLYKQNRKDITVTPDDTIGDPYSPAGLTDNIDTTREVRYLPGEVRDTAALFADTVRTYPSIVAKIHLLARSYGDSIVLRWAGEDYVVWKYLNDVGVNIYRFKKNSKDLGLDTLALALKPASYERFLETYPDTLDSLAYTAVQLLYGGGEIKPDQTESAPGTLGSLRELYDDQQMHFGMAMLTAELRPDLASMMALRFTDKTAKKGEEYEYIVQPAKPDTTGHLPIQGGHVESIKNVSYKPEPFKPAMGDSAVAHCATRLWWENLGRYASYEIYRRPSGSGNNWTKVNNKPYVIMHNDLDELDCYYGDEVSEPGNYDYKIYAHDAFGDLTEASPVHTVKIKDLQPTRAPEITAIFVDRPDSADLMKDVKATFHFEKDTMELDLDGYDLFYNREQTMSDEWKKLNDERIPSTATELTLDVTGLSSGEVMLVAYDKDGNKSHSLARYLRLTDFRAPLPPANFKAKTSNEDGTITLSWTEVDDDVDYYEIAVVNDTTHEWMLLPAGKLVDTLYVDTIAMDANQKYIYYKVRGVDYSSNIGEYTEPLQVLRPSDLPSSVAHLDSAWVDEKGINMHWVAPNEAQLDRMNIYRRTEGVEEWTRIASYTADTLAMNEWMAELTDAPDYNREHRYEYMAVTVGCNGMKSEKSIVYSARWEGDPVFDASIKLFANYDKDNQETKLAWEMDETPKYPGDWYFCIYRKGADNDEFQFLISADPNERSFSDFLLRKGETAEYYIFVQYKDGRQSQPSNTVSVSYKE